MSAVAEEATMLTFRSDIQINKAPDGSWLIGPLHPIPPEVFLPTRNPSELMLNGTWCLDPGMRQPPDFHELQRRISAVDRKDPRHFFIPASYLLGPLEK